MKYKEMLKDMPRIIIDQDAITYDEIADKMGVSYEAARRRAKKMRRADKWEEVKKYVGPKLFTAFRPKRPLGKH